MARLKTAEIEYKNSQGRELYSKGFSIIQDYRNRR